MNAFIFIAIVCIGKQCDFVTSNMPITEPHCNQMKQQFLALPFKPEITLAATQCLPFNDEKVKT
jgi:hypothetical protein